MVPDTTLSLGKFDSFLNSALRGKRQTTPGKGEAGLLADLVGDWFLKPQEIPALSPGSPESYSTVQCTPLVNPHPISQDAQLYLIDILGLDTAPFSDYRLPHVADCRQLSNS